jgi:hypothetical protein
MERAMALLIINAISTNSIITIITNLVNALQHTAKIPSPVGQ